LRGSEAKTLIPTVAQEKEWQLYAPEGRPPEIPELPLKIPGIWAEDNTQGLAQNVPPVMVELKPGVFPISQKQYFTRPQSEFKRVFDRLLKYGIL
jgi:hypothetical protein